MKFSNQFDVFVDHQFDCDHPSYDPTVVTNDMLYSIFPSTHSEKHYTPWSKNSLSNNVKQSFVPSPNNDYNADDWLSPSSDCKPKLVYRHPQNQNKR